MIFIVGLMFISLLTRYRVSFHGSWYLKARTFVSSLCCPRVSCMALSRSLHSPQYCCYLLQARRFEAGPVNFIFLFPRVLGAQWVLTKCRWDACMLNDWLKRRAHWFREFMIATRSKELCGSICEAVSNRRVMSVSRSRAALKNANWLLAQVLVEVFYSASVALFLSLTRERTEHSQMGLHQAGPTGARMNQVEGEWAESAARERLSCKVKPHWKQGRQKFFSGHYTRRRDVLCLLFYFFCFVFCFVNGAFLLCD